MIFYFKINETKLTQNQNYIIRKNTFSGAVVYPKNYGKRKRQLKKTVFSHK